MKKQLFTIFLLPVTLFSQEYLSNQTIERVRVIISQTVLQHYDEALTICDSLENEFPQKPVGYFFHAATLQSRMLDYENYDEIDDFFKNTQFAVELSKNDLKNYPNSSWPNFFLGGAIGYEAMVRGKSNELFRAFRDGWKSIRALQNALEIDSTNYDIYLGIGTYKYYRSQLSKYLKWLPFVDDEREMGKSMIRTAIDRGKLTRPAAINGLFWILVKEENYPEAEQLINTAITEYPGSRFFLWGKAKLEFKQGNWLEARNSYMAILETYRKENVSTPFNKMQCYTYLAEIYFNLGNLPEAIHYANNALEIEIDSYLQKRAKPIQQQAEDILQKAQKQSS
ncbi:tetratricopeptide repeat protein [candidate division KSB1 bacterium]|nr:tetratricopeptide repeat protein [candidate division KSB1 bacterium]